MTSQFPFDTGVFQVATVTRNGKTHNVDPSLGLARSTLWTYACEFCGQPIPGGCYVLGSWNKAGALRGVSVVDPDGNERHTCGTSPLGEKPRSKAYEARLQVEYAQNPDLPDIGPEELDRKHRLALIEEGVGQHG
jgi:hypothetical protein